jgi:hypothetical protein
MYRQEVPRLAPRRRQWLGITFVVVVVQLLVWNLYVIVRNQSLLPADETPRSRSGNIETLAMKNPADVVRYALATFYYLRVLAGKVVVVPPTLARFRLFFEGVSRLHAELAPAELPLDELSCYRLQELVERRYFLDVSLHLDVVLEPSAPRFVIATCTKHSYLLVPEPTYRTLASAPAAEAGR